MMGGKSLSEIKVMTLSTDEIATGIPEVVEQWRDTFGN
jgi:iron(III) transport system substrate-binding protein